MNPILASIIHVDNLLWCELVLLAVLVLGTIVTSLPNFKSLVKKPLSSSLLAFLFSAVPVIVLIALIRANQIVDAPLNKVIIVGTVIVCVSALASIKMKTLKRAIMTFAIAQSGFVFFMVGSGPAGVIAGLIHIASVAVVISGLLFTVDSMTTERRSWMKVLFGILFSTLVAVPLSGLFATETIAFGYGLQENLIPTLLVMLAVTVLTLRTVFLALPVLMTKVEAPLPSLAQDGNPTIAQGVTADRPSSNLRSLKEVILRSLVPFTLSLHIILSFTLGIFLLTQQGVQLAVQLAETVTSL